MLFKNNVLQGLASSSTALFLATMIIATFVQVAIANTAPALENTDSPDVPGNDSRERMEADAGKLAHSLSPLPRDTSLFYIWGLLTPAKNYAAKSNLSTIWNVYEGHYYPPDSHTDAERQKFYRILACGYIDTCWGIVWPMVSSFWDLEILEPIIGLVISLFNLIQGSVLVKSTMTSRDLVERIPRTTGDIRRTNGTLRRWVFFCQL